MKKILIPIANWLSDMSCIKEGIVSWIEMYGSWKRMSRKEHFAMLRIAQDIVDGPLEG